MLWICIVAPQSPSQFKCQGDLALQVASVRIVLQFGPTIDHRLCVPAGRQSFSPVQVACRARCVSKCCLAGGNARLLPGIQHREALHAGDGFGMITCDVMRDGQIPVVPVWMQGIEPNRCVQAGDALVWLSTKGQHISKHRERIRIRRIGVYRLAGRVFGSVEFAAGRFGTRLVVVLGHSRCGAILATLEELGRPTKEQSRNLRSIVDRIRPSVEPLLGTELGQHKDQLVEHAVRANIRVSANHLRHGSEVLEQLIQNDGLLVVGAEYSLETGLVDFFDGVPGDTR